MIGRAPAAPEEHRADWRTRTTVPATVPGRITADGMTVWRGRVDRPAARAHLRRALRHRADFAGIEIDGGVAQMAGARRERQGWCASEPDLGKFRGQAEMPQDPFNDARLFDQGDQKAAAPAPRLR